VENDHSRFISVHNAHFLLIFFVLSISLFLRVYTVILNYSDLTNNICKYRSIFEKFNVGAVLKAVRVTKTVIKLIFFS